MKSTVTKCQSKEFYAEGIQKPDSQRENILKNEYYIKE